MSGLKQLKTQMNTVSTTMKITTAMRMIAVSGLRKSHALLLDAYPYLDEITRVVRRLVRSISYRQEQLIASGSSEVIPIPFLLKGREIEKKHIVVCVTSDEGLCGRFNYSVIAKTEEVLKYLQTETNQEISVICFGNRGAELLRKKNPSLKVHQAPRRLRKDVPLFGESERMAMNLVDAFYRGDFDVCTVVYSEFENAAVQKMKVEQIIPLQMFLHENKWDFLNEDKDPNYVKRDIFGEKHMRTPTVRLFSAIGGQKIKSPLGQVDADALLKESTRLPDAYDYNASDVKILEHTLPEFVESHIYKVLLNTMASESAARMIAMENASKNATDMMKSFKKKFHRRRQELVTKDLTEVVAGSMS